MPRLKLAGDDELEGKPSMPMEAECEDDGDDCELLGVLLDVSLDDTASEEAELPTDTLEFELEDMATSLSLCAVLAYEECTTSDG